MNETEQIAAGRQFAGAGLLSNGSYHVLVTDSGTGYSALDEFALTRWRAARPAGSGGTYLYIQDLESGALWSATHEPTRRRADQYEAWLGPGCFHIRRSDDGIETHLEVSVAPDTPAEIRRYTFTNHSTMRRRLRVTSYAEAVLYGAADDAAHPAFSKLFVETEYLPEINGILARRRPRSPDDRFPLLLHALVSPSESGLNSDGSPPASSINFETDRAAFIRRGRSLADPLALSSGEPLAGSVGGVLDPVLSLQTELVLEPGQSEELIFVSAAGYSKDEVVGAAAQFRGKMARAEAFLQAALRDQHARDALGLGPRNADRYHRIAAGILLRDAELAASDDVKVQDSGGVAAAGTIDADWSMPVLLGRVAGEDELAVARLLLKARDYWKELGLRTQIILLNDKSGSEAEALQSQLKELIASTDGGHEGVVLRHSDTLDDDVQRSIQRCARLFVNGDRISLLRVRPSEPDVVHEPPLPNSRPRVPTGMNGASERRSEASASPAIDHLRIHNGYGGFSNDGTEYVIHVTPTPDGHLRLPPMPWVNVVANESGGFLVSETGSGYTWHANSRENRLTPWSNDPILDPAGEALYIRDEESGELWSPTPGPAPSGAAVEVRHGMGYTEFRQSSFGFDQHVTMFMPKSDPVKIVRLDLKNTGIGPRRLRVGSFARWTLGSSNEAGPFQATTYDEETDTIRAVNRRNEPYHEHTAFAALISAGDVEAASHTGAWESFVGMGGDPGNPSGFGDDLDLDGRTGAGLDPCAAFSKTLVLGPGETRSVFSLLGQVASVEDIPEFIRRYGNVEGTASELDEVKRFWHDLTSRLQISTPAAEIDLMVNGWLHYQNLSCRIWGRSAFYQSGGAYGFRDQLQDASAFASTAPHLVREQILLHAAHQFEDGDVMHWWHPPRSRGIRTRFSDDLLWLPYVTLDYVATTADFDILDEEVPYLTGPELPAGEDEIFIEPGVSPRAESLYSHCCRAIDRSLTKGPNGLPLIGSGDWNDGMNRVGQQGKGESVWLGFFIYDILKRFIPICEARTEMERVERYQAYLAHLEEVLNEAGWDGGWYRRAYYDNGAVIGSAQSEEAKIDALVQAWAVISGAAPEERAGQALDAMEARLVSEREGIIRLLSPPFDHTQNDPGYIKGYIPGVRENGGQYTHAALWAVKALAEAGRCERAAPLLAMLSPIAHTRTADDVARYKVEPYVIAADIYGQAPHIGRGGWTWYTGSAGWMHRVAVESILGFRVIDGKALEIAPRIPSTWNGFEIEYRHPGTEAEYTIRVVRDSASERAAANRTAQINRVTQINVNGMDVAPEDGKARIALASHGRKHDVEITLGA